MPESWGIDAIRRDRDGPRCNANDSSVPGGSTLARAGPTAVTGVQQWPFVAMGKALEVVPRTLAQNCGANIVRAMTLLRAKHTSLAPDKTVWGIDGETGQLTDMAVKGLFEPYNVKVQTLKTSIEAACMILRIDDIVSGMKKS